ncbi:MAG TPA: hypothetical protein ENI69_00655 [Rhodospirillales bacterium]|nr:hypothetical protein [Rhodospirillales bacterium]
MKIGDNNLDTDVYIIAEAGGCHTGDPDTVYQLVEAAAATGANAVKFQSYIAERLVHPDAIPLPIIGKTYRTQQDWFRRLELDRSVYEKIIELCKNLGIDFLTTPFDPETLDYFAPHMDAIKVASGDLTYCQLIDAAVATGKPVILSTGLASIEEIKVAAQRIPESQLILLHCVSVYPTPAELVNLTAIKTLQKEFPDTPIGFSDHSIGAEACIAAVALGARVIEKHFTLDSTQRPGDHILSLEPDQMKSMVSQIRAVNKMAGDGNCQAGDAELQMREQMQRGVYYASDLAAGHVLKPEDFMIVRPRSDLQPVDVESLIGKSLQGPVTVAAAVSFKDAE